MLETEMSHGKKCDHICVGVHSLLSLCCVKHHYAITQSVLSLELKRYYTARAFHYPNITATQHNADSMHLLHLPC